MRNTILVIIGSIIIGALLGYGLGRHSAEEIRWVSSLEEAGIELKPETEEEKKVYDSSDPIVKVDNPIFDFGILEKNEKTEKGSHDFVLENVGGSELTLEDGGKGCMCTNFAIMKKSLKKGEKTTVNFSWDGTKGGGVFDQSVRIKTNDPKHKDLYLTVRGLYSSSVLGNPNQIQFNGIGSGASASRDFKIFGFVKDKQGKPFPLEILEKTISDSQHFEIELKKGTLADMDSSEKENRLLQKATCVYVGKLKLKPGIPQGSFQEVMRFRTNDEKIPILEMLVEGQIAGVVNISGNKYDRTASGRLLIGAVSSAKGETNRIRLTVVDKFIANEQTVRVASVRPKWLEVKFKYPDENLQKSMPAKMIEVDVIIPKGAPQENFVGPEKERLGEIVFRVGATPETDHDIVLPVHFAVGP